MSDNDTPAPSGSNGQFTPREMELLSWAMQSCKVAPEIDYEKLAAFAGMSNHRSAYNAWTKIKGKLGLGAASKDANKDGDKAVTPSKTLRGKKATAAKKTEDDSGEGDTVNSESSSKKTPRKRAAKKQEVDGEEGSPKKKGRKPAGKTKKALDEEPTIKAENSGDEKTASQVTEGGDIKEESQADDDNTKADDEAKEVVGVENAPVEEV